MAVGRTRVAMLAVVVVAAAVIAFLLVTGDDDDDRGAEEPTIVSADELREVAEDSGRPIYWAGERPDTRLEYERTEDGLVYVRYLTGDADAGDPSNSFLTVGTYSVDNPIQRLEASAKKPDTARHNLPGGGLVVIDTENATSAYLAHPGAEEQVEVYDPDPDTAIRVATSGEVVPID